MNISEPFIRRPVATTLMMAALAFVGLVSYPFLPIAVFAHVLAVMGIAQCPAMKRHTFVAYLLSFPIIELARLPWVS